MDQPPNDVKFPTLKNLDWSAGSRRASIEEIYSESVGYASAAISWYLSRKRGKRAGARLTRLAAILLVLISGLTPLLGEIFQSGGKPLLSPLIASITLVLAAGCLGLDRFFGYSVGYMRYLSTELRLQRLLLEHQMEWHSGQASWAGAQPSADMIQEAIAECKHFLVEVHLEIQTETDSWAQEFTAALLEIDKNTRVQSEVGRAGAVNIRLTNGPQCEEGWSISVDGGPPSRSSGSTGALHGLLPGAHTFLITGKIAGVVKRTERNVFVTAGTVIESELTLA